MNSSWVAKWRGVRVFVLGDVMLDKFVHGRVERISPEAPIPVLHHQSEEVMLGGAANVARNIIALGGEVLLGGALGTTRRAILSPVCWTLRLGSRAGLSARLITRRRRKCAT